MNSTDGKSLASAHRQIDADNRFAIFCGDALSVLADSPDENFAAAITSPPYWGLRSYGPSSTIGSEKLLSDYIDSIIGVMREVRRVLRKDGVLWLVIGDTFTAGHRKYRAEDKRVSARGMNIRPPTPAGLRPKELIGVPWRLAFALQADGWLLRTDVIWAKPNPFPESVRDRPHRSHEFIFMMTKSSNYFFNPSFFSHPTLGRSRFSRSVWSVSVGGRRSGHPAAFPLELIAPCILMSTRPGDLILDPFCGSGSVGLACLPNGRRFVGVEILPEFAQDAFQSLQDACNSEQLSPL